MTYRSLLVLIGADSACATRSRAAIALARQLEAHLVGLAPTGLVDLPVIADPSGSIGDLAALTWTTLRDQAALSAQRFRDDCRQAGLPSFEAVVDEAEQATSLVHHAHCSDLCIVSQADPAASDHRAVQRQLGQVVLQCARPTLVLPYAGDFDSLGSRIMVAWDDSREAARAISDALPLLRRAASVHVVDWIESVADSQQPVADRLAALQRWLLWQGVTAEVRTETSGIAIADAMLSRAADLRADLIVMGAWGHARWTERILGGATRGLLASMTVPVLMSH